MNHKLIVFDWNGTLLSDTVAAWKAANICLQHYGAAPISLAHYRETFHFPVIHFYRLNNVDVDTVLADKEGNGLFQREYERLAVRARTRGGARELLGWLKARDYSCIILSNYRTERIEAHLKRLKLEPYFHHISANNDDGTSILHSTSKAERLSAFIAKRNFKPRDTVIIGDSMEEPEIARHLGLTSIGITDGTISRARLKEARPDYIVTHLQEIKGTLEKL